MTRLVLSLTPTFNTKTSRYCRSNELERLNLFNGKRYQHFRFSICSIPVFALSSEIIHCHQSVFKEYLMCLNDEFETRTLPPNSVARGLEQLNKLW